MNIIKSFTVENWIAIAGIAIPIFLILVGNVRRFIWKHISGLFKNRKMEVITEEIDYRFTSLNKQLKVIPFLNKKGHISLDALLENHKALCQNEIKDAGTLRKNNVYIKKFSLNNIKGETTILEDNEENSIINVIPYDKINLTLNDIVKDWNKKITKICTYSTKDKVDYISRFHLYFELIHPFLDGNGRIGRMLIEEQLSYIFNKTIKFEPDNKSYFEAFELAIKGDESKLRKLILDQIND